MATTIPTPIPLTPAGTQDAPTWAEAGAPVVLPPNVGAGLTPGGTLASNTVNYLGQHPARWTRAINDRTVPSDSGLWGTFVFPGGGGEWNVAGGTLAATLGPSRVMVDADGDGGVAVEVSFPVCDPLVLAPSIDSTISLTEEGVLAVAVGAGEQPPPSAAHVNIWVLTTDAIEVTAANLADKVPQIPKLLTVAVEEMVVGGILEVNGPATLNGDLEVCGNTTLGDDAADTVSIPGVITVEGTGVSIVTGVFTATPATGTFLVNGNVDATGGVILGSDDGDLVTVNGTINAIAAVTLQTSLTVNGDATLGESGDELTVNSTATFNDDAEVIAGKLLTVDAALATVRRWVSSGTTLPAAAGDTRWNGTFFSARDGAGQVMTFENPVRGYDSIFTTVNAIADTTAAATRRVKHNEAAWIVISARFEGTVALASLNVRLKVTGPLGAAEPIVDTYRIQATGTGYTLYMDIQWTPTDTWPAEVAEQGYAFLVRLGVSSGTLTANRVAIKVSSAWQI